MRKLVKLSVSFATIGVLAVLAACGGGGGNSGGTVPQSGQNTAGKQQVHRLTTGPTASPTGAPFGGGATFPGYAYNGGVQATAPPHTNSLFASYGGSSAIEYCLTGSGYGKTVFTNNGGADTAQGTCAAIGSSPSGFQGPTARPDFIGSDQAMTTADYSTYSTNEKTANGEPFEMPAIGGSIAVAFVENTANGINTTTVKLSPNTICDIFSGNVTDWTNSEITTDNGGTPVTSQSSLPIFVNYRSDGSGTTFLFETYLNDVCPSGSYWDPANHPASTTWGGPTGGNFVGSSGNPGVAHSIQREASSPTNEFGATGYVEAGWLSTLGRPTLNGALVENAQSQFVSPTSATAITAGLSNAAITQGGSAGGSLGSSLPACILYVDPSTFINQNVSGAYPIVGVSYLMFYSKGNNGVTGSAQLNNLQTLVAYIAAGHIGTLGSTGYVALPSSILTAIGTAGSESGTNCLDQDM